MELDDQEQKLQAENQVCSFHDLQSPITYKILSIITIVKMFWKDDPTARNTIPSENQMSEFRHNVLATSRRNSTIAGPPLHRGSIVADHLVVPPQNASDEK
jgi:hypothetical protein